MFVTCCYISIGDYEFDYVTEIEINQDITTLTDTATLILPRKLSWEGKDIAIGDDPIFKRGDVVKIRLGFDGQLKTRFLGYIKEIKAGMPVTMYLEDTMFLLKREPITRTYVNASLGELLADIIPTGIEYEFASETAMLLGPLRLNRVSAAKVLEELKSRGLYCYFRNIPFTLPDGTIDAKPVLYVGLAYWLDNRNEVDFEFGHNIINPYELVYKRKEDIRLKAKATSWQANNTKIETEVGDDDGEQRTIYKYNASLNELIIYAKSELERYKYTGYRGSFLTFGVPEIEKSDICSISGNKYHPDGKYLTDKVKITFGINGYFQEISPGPIINDSTGRINKV